MPSEAAAYPVTIAVSDQRRQAEAELRVTVDGGTVIEHRPDAVGGWKEDRSDLARGAHIITVTELRSGVTASRRVEVDAPLWVTIMLFAPPDGWRIDVSDRPVGLQ